MNKEIIVNYLQQSINDEKSLRNSINMLQVLQVIGSILIAIVAIAAMQESMMLGIGLLIFVFVNYLVMMFLHGIGKTLLNIQRASFITMLNTSKNNNEEYFAFLNLNLSNRVNENSSRSQNMSDMLAAENKKQNL
jgi:hypothetical protein